MPKPGQKPFQEKSPSQFRYYYTYHIGNPTNITRNMCVATSVYCSVTNVPIHMWSGTLLVNLQKNSPVINNEDDQLREGAK